MTWFVTEALVLTVGDGRLGLGIGVGWNHQRQLPGLSRDGGHADGGTAGRIDEETS